MADNGLQCERSDWIVKIKVKAKCMLEYIVMVGWEMRFLSGPPSVWLLLFWNPVINLLTTNGLLRADCRCLSILLYVLMLLSDLRVFVFSVFFDLCFSCVFSERELKFMFAIGYRPSVCRLSVCLSSVCNVRAPYSGDWNFRQYFYAMWYLGHPWPLYKNFTEIVSGEPLRRGS